MDTKQELVEKAKALGLAGYSRMNKKTLRDKIARAETGTARGLEIVRKAVAESVRDEFPSGTVIRWQRSGRYTYAALKVDNGKWYTTSASFNTYVPQILDFDDLLDVITESEASEVSVATAWETLD